MYVSSAYVAGPVKVEARDHHVLDDRLSLFPLRISLSSDNDSDDDDYKLAGWM